MTGEILGLLLVFIGLAIIIYALYVLSRKGSFEGGGLILIGPIPILFGSKGFIKRFWIVIILLIMLFILFTLFPYIIYLSRPSISSVIGVEKCIVENVRYVI